jgi:signal transduction histidine kinase
MSDLPPAELIEQLQRRIADLELLTARCAHDLQGPVATIGGFLKSLSSSAKAGRWDDFDADVKRITHLVNLQRRTLSDLLAVIRSRASLSPQNLSFEDLLRAATASLAALIAHRGAVIHVDRDMPMILGDESALTAVLQNLIENAIHAAPDCQSPQMEIHFQPGAGEFQVRLRDYGVGIPVEDRDRVWEPFVRLRSEQTGSGLGLYLVKQLIQQHNGRVWIESPASGPGTVVCFTLPVL